MRTTLITLALIVAPFSVAMGQPESQYWATHRRCYRHVDSWGAVSYPCVRWRSPVRYYAPPRRDWDEERWERRDPALERGEHCKGSPVRVVGELHVTKEGALNAAVRQWQATVRYDEGEKFMDIENARGYRWRCDRASTNETTLGKIGETVGAGSGFQKRCVVLATPCRMPVLRGDRDER